MASKNINNILQKRNFSSNNNNSPSKKVNHIEMENIGKNMTGIDEIKQIINETMESKISSLKEFIESQNTVIVGLVAENAALLKKMLSSEQEISKMTEKFPIQTVEDLNDLEKNLDESVIPNYIAAVRRIVTSNGLVKCFGKLFSKEIFLNFNYDGIKEKSAFKDFKKVNDLLFRATDKGDSSMTDFKQQIRKGFKLCRNAHFKNSCLQRKSGQKTTED